MLAKVFNDADDKVLTAATGENAPMKDEIRDRHEFSQAQILYLLASLSFFKKFDRELLEFWRETEMTQRHLKVVSE